jgi:hypothetical protein
MVGEREKPSREFRLPHAAVLQRRGSGAAGDADTLAIAGEAVASSATARAPLLVVRGEYRSRLC